MTNNARWRQVISDRNVMLANWRNPEYVKFWRQIDTGNSPPDDVADAVVKSQTLILQNVQSLYYVDEHATDQWVVASKTFQPEPLVQTDLMTPSGLVVCDRQLVVDPDADLSGDNDDHRGVISTGPGKVAFLWMGGINEFDDFILFSAYIGRPGHRWSWLMGSHTRITFGDEPTHGMTAMFQVLMRLMQQRVLSTTQRTAGSKKTKRQGKINPVNIVHLPRTVTDAIATGQGGNYSHRWWVAGHWRNQWYPSLGLHRQKWIHGYVKGPDGTPFIPKTRIGTTT